MKRFKQARFISPGFLPSRTGRGSAHLSEYRGRKVILYFYPKDNTPGCTKQAVGFAERYSEFLGLGVTVIGVSKDSVQSHKNFETKYNLPFALLSDVDKTCIEAYDVWKEKKNYGKVSMCVARFTYQPPLAGVL